MVWGGFYGDKCPHTGLPCVTNNFQYCGGHGGEILDDGGMFTLGFQLRAKVNIRKEEYIFLFQQWKYINGGYRVGSERFWVFVGYI